MRRDGTCTAQCDSTINGSGDVQVEGERTKAENHHQHSVSSAQEVETDLLNHSNSPLSNMSSVKGPSNLNNSQSGLDKLCQAFDKLEGPTGARWSTHQQTESLYMCALHDGLGMTDRHSNGPVLPRRMLLNS
jgi:hypothetical protein